MDYLIITIGIRCTCFAATIAVESPDHVLWRERTWSEKRVCRPKNLHPIFMTIAHINDSYILVIRVL